MRTFDEMCEFFGSKAIILCNCEEDMRIAAQLLKNSGCEASPYSTTINSVLRGQTGVWRNSIYKNIQVDISCGSTKYDMCGRTNNLKGRNMPVFSVSDVVNFFSEPDGPFTEQEFDAAFADLLR